MAAQNNKKEERIILHTIWFCTASVAPAWYYYYLANALFSMADILGHLGTITQLSHYQPVLSQNEYLELSIVESPIKEDSN